jgi:hypothetical protein
MVPDSKLPDRRVGHRGVITPTHFSVSKADRCVPHRAIVTIDNDLISGLIINRVSTVVIRRNLLQV